MDELACFAPGMLALGASGYGPEKSEQIMNLAKEVNPLGNPNCYWSFQVFACYFEIKYDFLLADWTSIFFFLSIHVIAC